jgi:RuvB-like protein 2
VVARKRKSAEVGVEDIAKCYGYFLDEKRSTQWLAEQQGSLVFDALADGDVAMASA